MNKVSHIKSWNSPLPGNKTVIVYDCSGQARLLLVQTASPAPALLQPCPAYTQNALYWQLRSSRIPTNTPLLTEYVRMLLQSEPS